MLIDLIIGGVLYSAVLVSCYDGDSCTVRFSAEQVAVPILREQKLRFTGFDTPEIRGHCPAEAALARQARAITLEFMAGSGAAGGKRGGAAVRMDGKRDKYGRLLVSAPALKSELIARGLAREYAGGSRRTDGWCS